MSSFQGGSPFAMVRDIGEGYILLSKPKLKRYTLNDLQRLIDEIEKAVRTLRSDAPDSSDPALVQKHNRKLQRLLGAQRMLKTDVQEKKRRGVG